MTCALTNQTPLVAMTRTHRDPFGTSCVLVIAKACWSLSTGRMAPAERQLGINLQPLTMELGEFELDDTQIQALQGRLNHQVVWIGDDLTPPKPAFDVIFAGYVTAPEGFQGAFVDAGLRIGHRSGTMRAHVPRSWKRGWLGHRATALSAAFKRMPVSYAFADWSEGFPLVAASQGKDSLPPLLPWIESTSAQAQYRRYARKPAGLGYWPENARHRKIHAGTFDDAWEARQSPMFPRDFNPLFYNAAHPDMQLPSAPAGGTPIRLVHLSRHAVIDCVFPSVQLAVQMRTAAGRELLPIPMTPDTLVIEPELDRMSVVWRAMVPAGADAETIRSCRLYRPRAP